MKVRRINTMARLTGITMALALFAGVASVNAQTQVKGAQRLLELNGRLVTPKAQPSDYKPMSCAKCKDTAVTVRDTELKGLGARTLLAGGPPTKVVARHECEGCGNEWIVSGHGKAKTSVASHKCTSCGAESLACCNTTKSSAIATKGMEKKFEVAPLK